MEVAGPQPFCPTCGFSFCISLPEPRPASLSSSPLSFRSAKVLEDLPRKPWPRQLAWAPHTVRGGSHPLDRVRSDRVRVWGLPPPARSVAGQGARAEGPHWACLECRLGDAIPPHPRGLLELSSVLDTRAWQRTLGEAGRGHPAQEAELPASSTSKPLPPASPLEALSARSALGTACGPLPGPLLSVRELASCSCQELSMGRKQPS